MPSMRMRCLIALTYARIMEFKEDAKYLLIGCFTAHQHIKDISAKKRC